MSCFRVSEAARRDLEEIWHFIATDNPAAADKFLEALNSRFLMLVSMPEMGRKREELLPQLRSFAFGNYVTFYRIGESGIEIVRVLHGARDLPPLFE